MSKSTLYTQIENATNNILNLQNNLNQNTGNSLSPWNNMDYNDFINSYEILKKDLITLSKEIENFDIPWNILNSFVASLTNAHIHIQAFFNAANQNTFTNAFTHVESLRTNMRTWALTSRDLAENEINNKLTQINTEIDSVIKKKETIELLEQTVNSLVMPGVSGSLSKSFSNRAKVLNLYERRWKNITIWTAILTLLATILVGLWVNTLLDTNKENIKKVAIVKDKNSTSVNAKTIENYESDMIWLSMTLRLGILIPFYYFLSIAFSQYRKERELLESYSHKAAIATSLPNYGNLAVDSTVKDQIITEASKEIFSSPDRPKKDCKNTKDNIDIKELKNTVMDFVKTQTEKKN